MFYDKRGYKHNLDRTAGSFSYKIKFIALTIFFPRDSQVDIKPNDKYPD